MSTPVTTTGAAERPSSPPDPTQAGAVASRIAPPDQPDPTPAESRRVFPRIPCRVLVDYVVEGRAYRDCIANISEGGAFIETSIPLEAGRPITLSFSLFQDQQPVKVVGEVAWAGATGVGVRFRQNQAISQFCSQQEDSVTYPLQSPDTPTPSQPATASWGRRTPDVRPNRRPANPSTTLPVWVALALVVILALISRYDTNARIQSVADKVDWAAQNLVRLQWMATSHPAQAGEAAPVRAALNAAAPSPKPSPGAQPTAVEPHNAQVESPAAAPAAPKPLPAAQPAAVEQPVPRAAVSPAAPVPPRPAAAAPLSAADPEPSPETTYIVQPGDNLYRIGLRFNIRTDALMEHNGLARPDSIVVGQRIRIPAGNPR